MCSGREERAINNKNRLRLLYFSPQSDYGRLLHVMSTATIASIIDQVKLDIFSKTQTTDNANKRKEVSRTFICENG
jgi:hypothetical protein